MLAVTAEVRYEPLQWQFYQGNKWQLRPGGGRKSLHRHSKVREELIWWENKRSRFDHRRDEETTSLTSSKKLKRTDTEGEIGEGEFQKLGKVGCYQAPAFQFRRAPNHERTPVMKKLSAVVATMEEEKPQIGLCLTLITAGWHCWSDRGHMQHFFSLNNHLRRRKTAIVPQSCLLTSEPSQHTFKGNTSPIVSPKRREKKQQKSSAVCVCTTLTSPGRPRQPEHTWGRTAALKMIQAIKNLHISGCI